MSEVGSFLFLAIAALCGSAGNDAKPALSLRFIPPVRIFAQVIYDEGLREKCLVVPASHPDSRVLMRT
jgi:hypothetical protein